MKRKPRWQRELRQQESYNHCNNENSNLFEGSLLNLALLQR